MDRQFPQVAAAVRGGRQYQIRQCSHRIRDTTGHSPGTACLSAAYHQRPAHAGALTLRYASSIVDNCLCIPQYVVNRIITIFQQISTASVTGSGPGRACVFVNITKCHIMSISNRMVRTSTSIHLYSIGVYMGL